MCVGVKWVGGQVGGGSSGCVVQVSSIGNRHSRHKHVFRKVVFAPIGLALEGIGKSRFLPVFSVPRMTGGGSRG